MIANARTGNNAVAFEHSENNLLEFFSKAGSLYTKKGTYYGNESTALELFKVAWRTDPLKSMQLALWLRNCRGGAGNRSGFRTIIKWLGENYSEWITSNIDLIPKYGRWDDLCALYDTSCEGIALKTWSKAILDESPSVCGLACKWADRQDRKLRDYMRLTPKNYRHLLVSKTKVVETLMCNREWSGVEYNHVPSVASARYKNAFKKHDSERYDAWRLALATPDSGAKVNAGTIFPHDVIRMIRNTVFGDMNTTNALAEAQFEAMPNYLEGTKYRIMPICDFSGSMEGPHVSGSITAFDVALSLGLYCSDAVGKSNPFWRKLIPFSTDSKLESWDKMSLVEAVSQIPNGYCGSTNIKKALSVLLDAGKFFKATDEQMPNVLMILSDMQFDQGVTSTRTPIEEGLQQFEEAGYTRPKIIYWNLAGCQNQPATFADKNVALVSGFSPSILKSVLGGKDFSPIAIMNDTISEYKIVDPRS